MKRNIKPYNRNKDFTKCQNITDPAAIMRLHFLAGKFNAQRQIPDEIRLTRAYNSPDHFSK